MPHKKTNNVFFDNGLISVMNRKFTVKSSRTILVLSKNQNILLGCLLRGVIDKHDIIETIWPGCDWESKHNSYRQLLFQTRALLRQAGLPDDSLIRLSKNNICLNSRLFKPNSEANPLDVKQCNDPGLFCFY